MTCVSSALRSSGNQCPEGMFVTVRSAQAARMGRLMAGQSCRKIINGPSEGPLSM